MTWYTTKVSRLDNLDNELQRLEDAGHDIFSIVVIEGYTVIISSITP